MVDSTLKNLTRKEAADCANRLLEMSSKTVPNDPEVSQWVLESYASLMDRANEETE